MAWDSVPFESGGEVGQKKKNVREGVGIEDWKRIRKQCRGSRKLALGMKGRRR